MQSIIRLYFELPSSLAQVLTSRIARTANAPMAMRRRAPPGDILLHTKCLALNPEPFQCLSFNVRRH